MHTSKAALYGKSVNKLVTRADIFYLIFSIVFFVIHTPRHIRNRVGIHPVKWPRWILK
jgi:hypothetical protein